MTLRIIREFMPRPTAKSTSAFSHWLLSFALKLCNTK